MGTERGENDGGAQSPEQQRFCALYERWHGPIHAYGRRRLIASAVDDAVAETFIVAWRRIDDVPAGREALLWLYRVAYRVVGHSWRSDERRRRLGERLDAEPAAVEVIPDELVVLDDEVRRVRTALGQLKPRDAEILRLVAWEGLSSDDLSNVLDVRPNTARQRLARARKQLARRVDALEHHHVHLFLAPRGASR